MSGPPAATAAVRVAVRRCLGDVDGAVAAAVSGGADSLALAAALAFERPGSSALVVDHGLQPGSAEVAARAAEQCSALGLVPHVLPVVSHGPSAEARRPPQGARGEGGPEAVARRLRYDALAGAVTDLGLAAVLLGHTLDDQAETVLLGLARGSGARSLAGMAPVRGPFRRPLLEVGRATTRQACEEAGLTPWEDPHNDDPAFARSRVRARVLPVLEAELGPGVAESLARSARLLREDADALDAAGEAAQTDEVQALERLDPAVRARALKGWAEAACGRAVTGAHVAALRALVEDWRGQGPVDLPGGGRVAREGGRLAFRA